MTTQVKPEQILVLDLQPNDVLFIASHAIDESLIECTFPVQIVGVKVPIGMSVADCLAVVRPK